MDNDANTERTTKENKKDFTEICREEEQENDKCEMPDHQSQKRFKIDESADEYWGKCSQQSQKSNVTPNLQSDGSRERFGSAERVAASVNKSTVDVQEIAPVRQDKINDQKMQSEPQSNDDADGAWKSKREQRLAKERRSARERRKRKAMLIIDLQTRVSKLTKRNSEVRAKNERLLKQIEEMRRPQSSDRSAESESTTMPSMSFLLAPPLLSLPHMATSQPGIAPATPPVFGQEFFSEIRGQEFFSAGENNQFHHRIGQEQQELRQQQFLPGPNFPRERRILIGEMPSSLFRFPASLDSIFDVSPAQMPNFIELSPSRNSSMTIESIINERQINNSQAQPSLTALFIDQRRHQEQLEQQQQLESDLATSMLLAADDERDGGHYFAPQTMNPHTNVQALGSCPLQFTAASMNGLEFSPLCSVLNQNPITRPSLTASSSSSSSSSTTTSTTTSATSATSTTSSPYSRDGILERMLPISSQAREMTCPMDENQLFLSSFSTMAFPTMRTRISKENLAFNIPTRSALSETVLRPVSNHTPIGAEHQQELPLSQSPPSTSTWQRNGLLQEQTVGCPPDHSSTHPIHQPHQDESYSSASRSDSK